MLHIVKVGVFFSPPRENGVPPKIRVWESRKEKSRFDYGDVFPRDSSTVLSLPLIGVNGREVVRGPEKMKSVLFTGKSSPSKQE